MFVTKLSNIFTAVYQVIVTNSLHVFLLIVRSIYIRPEHAHIWVVIVKGGELLGRRSVWKLALTSLGNCRVSSVEVRRSRSMF